MKNLSNYLLILLLTSIFYGCKDAENLPISSKENILNANTHIITSSAINNVTLSTLSIDLAKINFEPTVGDIILASPSTNNPKGVIAKILSLSKIGNSISCTIQSSNLNEAFKQLYIDYKSSNSYSGDANLRVAGDGSKLTLPFKDYSLTTGFTVNGTLNLNIPEVQIKYVKPENAILPDTVLVLANINTDASKLVMKATAKLNVPEKTLYTFNKLPIINVPVVVGGIPLIIPFDQVVEINTLPITISGKMKAEIRPEISASLGFSYIRGTWKNLSTFTINASASKPSRGDFEAKMNGNVVFFNPVYKIRPFWNPDFNVFFKVPNELELTIQTSKPNYSLKYKLAVEAGINYEFWLGAKGTKSTQLPVYDTVIKEGNWGLSIGDTAFGGIIFYLDSSGEHGMVYPMPNELPKFIEDFRPRIPYTDFDCNPTTDTTIGSGKSNTEKMIKAYGKNKCIARACVDLVSGGYSDWYFPSKLELLEIYKNKKLLPGIEKETPNEGYGYFCSSVLPPNPNISCEYNYILRATTLNMSTGVFKAGEISATHVGQYTFSRKYIPARSF